MSERDDGADDLRERTIMAELQRDRRNEHRLIPQTLIAFAVVAILVVIRQVFFA